MSYHLSARYLALWRTVWYIRPGYCIIIYCINCQFIVKYYCTSVLLYAKLLKETEKKHRLFLSHFIVGVISVGAGRAPCPPWLRLCLSAGTLILCDIVNPDLIFVLIS